MKNKLIIQSIIVVVVSALSLCLSLNLIGKDELQNSANCESFRTCINCNDKKGSLLWLKEFNKKYVSVDNVLSEISEYEKKTDKSQKLFSEDFYNVYGAYVFLQLPLKPSASNYVAMKHLLLNNVHPYDAVINPDTIAATMVSFEDVDGFKLLVESGKLTDCKSELNNLHIIAKRTKNEQIITFIENLLEQ